MHISGICNLQAKVLPEREGERWHFDRKQWYKWVLEYVETQREEFGSDVVILPVVLQLMRTSASVKHTKWESEIAEGELSLRGENN